METNRFEALIPQLLMDITSSYESPKPVIRIGEATIGTLGNFSASIGKAKSKKTFNVSAMVAAALSGRTVLGYDVTLPSDKNRVLYIDTEQGRDHYLRVMKRIHRMAGIDPNTNDNRLICYSLRRLAPQERVEMLGYLIAKHKNVGLVILDGVRDLLYDINSPSESTNIASLLLRWTDENQFHLHTVLHCNKSDDNARGHIGTEINNKAETVIQVERDPSDHNVSRVKPVFCRDREFEPFAFRIDDHGIPQPADDVCLDSGASSSATRRTSPEEISDEEHLKAVRFAFRVDDGELSRSALAERMKLAYYDICGTLGNHKVREIIAYLNYRGMIAHKEEGNFKSPWVIADEYRDDWEEPEEDLSAGPFDEPLDIFEEEDAVMLDSDLQRRLYEYRNR